MPDAQSDVMGHVSLHSTSHHTLGPGFEISFELELFFRQLVRGLDDVQRGELAICVLIFQVGPAVNQVSLVFLTNLPSRSKSVRQS